MTKEQYIDQYLDRYEREHPDERIDYDALREQADCEWYDKQVEKGEKTEYDLTAEQAKVAKDMGKGAHKFEKREKKPRVRKANPDKREIIATIAQNLSRVFTEDEEQVQEVEISNAERQIDFTLRGVRYSVQLIAHREPKDKAE
jgi:hypothetical protein